MAIAAGNRITLVTVTDTHYLPMVAALLKSVEANLDPAWCLDFWVVADGVRSKYRKNLEEAADSGVTSIHWVERRDVLPPDVKLPVDNSSFPSNIYLWYFMPYFLPEGTKRAIYMDADTLNCRDLVELWNTDLGNKIAGAVSDPRIRTFECDWGGILNFQELHLSGNLPYLNSGVLVVDLVLWRKQGITAKALNFVKENIRSAIYPEQYGINLALQGQWTEINHLWNFFATATTNNSPYNIHFVDRKPIYQSYRNNPSFRSDFMRYLAITPWFDFQPVSEIRRYRKKIANVLPKLWVWVVRGFTRFFVN